MRRSKGIYTVIFEVNFGESVEDFAGSCAHVTMWTAEFRKYVRYEE